MTYSTDFRRKVLEIKGRDGLSFEQAAALFGVGKSSVQRWTERLEQDVGLYPDAYRYERAERFGCGRVAV
jgi:transposase